MLFLCFAFALVAALIACSGNLSYHKKLLPDPSTYNAHFHDLDNNGDDRVDWQEFKQYFVNADADVYNELDLNKDQVVDHDEWHQFKKAHGLRHR